MTRRRKDSLRSLTNDERTWLDRIRGASMEPTCHVARSKALLAVADGQTDQAAANAAGRRSNDAVALLVARFNQVGVASIVPGHGSGAAPIYTMVERERILTGVPQCAVKSVQACCTIPLSTTCNPIGLLVNRFTSFLCQVGWTEFPHITGLTALRTSTSLIRPWFQNGYAKQPRHALQQQADAGNQIAWQVHLVDGTHIHAHQRLRARMAEAATEARDRGQRVSQSHHAPISPSSRDPLYAPAEIE